MASRLVHKFAERFSVDFRYAEEYLYRVQRRCLPNVPRYPVIVDAILRKGYTTLPESGQVAEYIKNTLISKLQNPNQQKNTHKLHKPRFHPTWRERQLLRDGIIVVDAPGRVYSREPGVVSHNKFDEERVSPDKLGHCPHGVPDGELCGICNLEEFRKMTGIE
jgi:hypothetical protein